MGVTLYEIGEAIRAIVDSTAETGGELTDQEMEQLERLNMKFEEKVESCCAVVCEIEAEEEAYRNEMKRLQAKASACAKRAGSLKGYVMEQLQLAGRDKVKGQFLTARLQNNPPSVTVMDEKTVPAMYWVQPPPVLDKQKVLAVLKAGEAVPGAELYRGVHLRIV